MGYQYFIVTTFINVAEQSSAKYRVRPLVGQGLPTNMRVECSRSMRKDHPLGTLFKIQAQLINKEGGTEFLYSRFDWDYEVVTLEQAKQFIKSRFS